MTDVTQNLNAIQHGDPSASDKLLPVVYEELRVLARQRSKLGTAKKNKDYRMIDPASGLLSFN